MDEDELLEYQRLIDLIEDRHMALQVGEFALLEQVRDENYERVPGCYRVLPAQTE